MSNTCVLHPGDSRQGNTEGAFHFAFTERSDLINKDSGGTFGDSGACREAGTVWSRSSKCKNSLPQNHSFLFTLSLRSVTLLITLFLITVNTLRDLRPACLVLPWVAGPAATQATTHIDPCCCSSPSILGATFRCSFSSTTAAASQSFMERLKLDICAWSVWKIPSANVTNLVYFTFTPTPINNECINK